MKISGFVEILSGFPDYDSHLSDRRIVGALEPFKSRNLAVRVRLAERPDTVCAMALGACDELVQDQAFLLATMPKTTFLASTV